ncbi:MAG: hypothetical protein GPJ51_12455 [Candidatus Heimdallarchaeota archaeon]|nr:hypothetical protein [Candidatus Heimdallarchaeota archaeon]
MSESKDILKAFNKSNNLEEAQELYDKLVDIFTEENNTLDKAHIKLILATKLLENDKYDKSKELFEEAKKEFLSSGEKYFPKKSNKIFENLNIALAKEKEERDFLKKQVSRHIDRLEKEVKQFDSLSFYSPEDIIKYTTVANLEGICESFIGRIKDSHTVLEEIREIDFLQSDFESLEQQILKTFEVFVDMLALSIGEISFDTIELMQEDDFDKQIESCTKEVYNKFKQALENYSEYDERIETALTRIVNLSGKFDDIKEDFKELLDEKKVVKHWQEFVNLLQEKEDKLKELKESENRPSEEIIEKFSKKLEDAFKKYKQTIPKVVDKEKRLKVPKYKQITPKVEDKEEHLSITHCPFCKSTLKKNAKYCPQCGREIPLAEKIYRHSDDMELVGALDAFLGMMPVDDSFKKRKPEAKRDYKRLQKFGFFASDEMQRKLRTPEYYTVYADEVSDETMKLFETYYPLTDTNMLLHISIDDLDKLLRNVPKDLGVVRTPFESGVVGYIMVLTKDKKGEEDGILFIVGSWKRVAQHISGNTMVLKVFPDDIALIGRISKSNVAEGRYDLADYLDKLQDLDNFKEIKLYESKVQYTSNPYSYFPKY